MISLVSLFLTVATGFVVAGLLESFYRLVTNRRLRFELLGEQGNAFAFGVPALLFAGPIVVLTNAIRGRLIEGRPAQWLAMSALICTAWSFFSGMFILNVLIALGTLS